MGRAYLIDTNAVIDLVTERLPLSSGKWLDNLFTTEDCYLSIINKIELLGYAGPDEEMRILKAFTDSVVILPPTDAIAEKTIEIRTAIKIKLPDAIIAATAVVHNLTIITRNQKDFSAIESLLVIDPYSK